MTSIRPNIEPDANSFKQVIGSELGGEFDVTKFAKTTEGGVALSISLGGKSYNITLNKELVDGVSQGNQEWIKNVANALKLVHANEGQAAEFDFAQKTVTWEGGPKINYGETGELHEKMEDLAKKLKEFEEASSHLEKEISRLTEETSETGSFTGDPRAQELVDKTERKTALDQSINKNKHELQATKIAFLFGTSLIRAPLPIASNTPILNTAYEKYADFLKMGNQEETIRNMSPKEIDVMLGIYNTIRSDPGLGGKAKEFAQGDRSLIDHLGTTLELLKARSAQFVKLGQTDFACYNAEQADLTGRMIAQDKGIGPLKMFGPHMTTINPDKVDASPTTIFVLTKGIAAALGLAPFSSPTQMVRDADELTKGNWLERAGPEGSGDTLQQFSGNVQVALIKMGLDPSPVIERHHVTYDEDNVEAQEKESANFQKVLEQLANPPEGKQKVVIVNCEQALAINDATGDKTPQGEFGGNYCIVGGYDKSSDKVLLLDVDKGDSDKNNGSYWVDRRALVGAMNILDTDSGINKGYISFDVPTQL